MLAWRVTRDHPTLGQTELVGHFSSKKKALSRLLVVIQNDFSINQRWPKLQHFYTVDVSVERLGKHMLWVTAQLDNTHKQAGYTIHAFRLE